MQPEDWAAVKRAAVEHPRWAVEELPPGGVEEMEFMDAEVPALWRKGAIECLGPTPPPGEVRLFGPMFAVPKPNSKKAKFRAVYDQRLANAGFKDLPVKFEGLGTILRMLGAGYFAAVIDLEAAYHHFEVKETHRCFMAFRWRGVWYRWAVLPFGWKRSPWHFTKLMRVMLRRWRTRGILVTAWLDDFVVMGRTAEECQKSLDWVLSEMRQLGLRPDPTKGCWQPAQRFRALGLVIDTAQRLVEAPEEKISGIVQLLAHLRAQPVWAVRQLAQLTGKVNSIARAFQPARLFTREFYTLVAEGTKLAEGWGASIVPSVQARADVDWLIENLPRRNGHIAWRPARVITVELLIDKGAGTWIVRVDNGCFQTGGQAGADEGLQPLPMMALEAYALAHGLAALAEHVRDRWLLLRAPESQIASWLSGRRSAVLGACRHRVQGLFEQMDKLGAAWWTAERTTAVVGAAVECASMVDPHDWRLRAEPFQAICRTFGTPVVDRMADERNTKCARFNSWRPCVGAEAVDCFTQDWAGQLNYVCPAFGVIHRVLLHIDQCWGAEAVLVFPKWPAQPWWPLLLQMVVQPEAGEGGLLHLGGQEVFEAGPSGRLEPAKADSWFFLAARVRSRLQGPAGSV